VGRTNRADLGEATMTADRPDDAAWYQALDRCPPEHANVFLEHASARWQDINTACQEVDAKANSHFTVAGGLAAALFAVVGWLQLKTSVWLAISAGALLAAMLTALMIHWPQKFRLPMTTRSLIDYGAMHRDWPADRLKLILAGDLHISYVQAKRVLLIKVLWVRASSLAILIGAIATAVAILYR